MSSLRVEVNPLKPAIRTDAPVTLDVLLTITPPDAPIATSRPTLNLGLVLDRSGSMQAANKMGFASEAAAFAVQQLRPTDRVSVTIFDDKVETIVPNVLAVDRAPILSSLREIFPRGSTALHAGWAEGAKQVADNRVKGGLNRVLLLSDGLANVGETNPDAIATDVHRCREGGVSTSTFGVGVDYNEDLMEALAKSGDGNYYYIRSPAQLVDIFQAELKELIGMVGTRVTATIEPADGVFVSDVLNDLDRGPDGEHLLPNLVAGLPVSVVVRVTIPPRLEPSDVCRFRLAWDAPGQTNRQELVAELRLPAVTGPAWESLASDVNVQEQVALLMIARAKKEATRQLELGDRIGTRGSMSELRRLACVFRADSSVAAAEAADQDEIEKLLEAGSDQEFLKAAKSQAYRRRQSKPS
jgi:Ca-activated chloride channel homolog